jgi:hypothetical protein
MSCSTGLRNLCAQIAPIGSNCFPELQFDGVSYLRNCLSPALRIFGSSQFSKSQRQANRVLILAPDAAAFYEIVRFDGPFDSVSLLRNRNSSAFAGAWPSQLSNIRH